MKKIYMVTVTLIMAILLINGCEVSQDVMPGIQILPKDANQGSFRDTLEPVASDDKIKYGGAGTSELTIENTRIWAEKNRKLAKQINSLNIQNAELVEDNQRLLARFNTMKAALERTEKELNEANDLLIEMRKELDGWKMNVLGFREEISEVHKEQTKALIKILKLMGAEYRQE